MTPRGFAWITALGFWLVTVGHAQAANPVYRCEEQGRVVYADEPCAKGSRASMVNVDDKRTPQERQAAQEVTQREARFAREARAQRLADERTASKLGAAGIGPAPRPTAEVTKKHLPSMRKAKKPKAKKSKSTAAGASAVPASASGK